MIPPPDVMYLLLLPCFMQAYGYLASQSAPPPEQPQKKAKVGGDTAEAGAGTGERTAEGQAGPEGATERRKLFVGSSALNFRRDHMEVESALRNGVIADWDAAEQMWEHAIR